MVRSECDEVADAIFDRMTSAERAVAVATKSALSLARAALDGESETVIDNVARRLRERAWEAFREAERG